MLSLLWLIPALPAAGFLLLTLLNRRLSRRAAAWIGAGSVGLAALVALLVCGSFIVSPPAGDAYHQVLWTWMDVDGFAPTIGFYLDAVSVVWVLVITFVGFLIHLYSTEHMEHDEGFTRFFMYLNLFVASMLVLVLADNLLLLYLGWEGVGLCSYLLISFWQKDPQNVYSGRKAFIVTRVGDTALIAGLFLLFTQLHTLQIQPMLAAAQEHFVPGSAVAVAAALLILGGAVGKSAQVPLQTWLPGRHGRPVAGQRAHPRRDHGHRRRLPHRAHQRALHARPGRAAHRRDRRHRDPGHRRLQRARPARPQARARLLHHQPDRLHVPGAGRLRLGGGRVPLHDARLLQGPALPRRRRDHRGARRRARHLQDGRAGPRDARRVLDLHHRRRRPCGAAVRHRRLLQQGPDHRHEPRVRGRQPVVLRRLSRRRVRDRAVLVPAGLHRLLRRAPHRGHAAAALAATGAALRARRPCRSSAASSGCRSG